VEVPATTDITYVGDAYGDPGAPPVFLLHGGGQTRHAWGNTAATLATAGFYSVAWDLRGHGDTTWAPDGDYELDSFAADLCALAGTVEGKPAVVGASLGGLTSLLAHARDPELMAAVVLVDVAPKMSPEGVVRIVSFMMARSKEGFATLEEAADAIAEFLPHRPRPKDLSGLQKNLRLHPDGRYRWHWDPAFVSREGNPDPGMTYDRLAAAARSLDMPTLLVRGRLSDVLSEEAAEDFRRLAPHSEFVNVADAAHMIAGDKNDAFCDAVVEFLRRVLPAPSLIG
jgi:pimeloyl-ACP methyl ester carboxylesterase